MKRTLIISDIHGCLKTLQALVDKVALTKSDQLIFIGDYIDRGPDSAGVIDFVMGLEASGYNVVPLKGNHEHHFCFASEQYDAATFSHYVCRLNKSNNLLDGDGKPIEKYINWMQNLPYYYLDERFMVVHAGVNVDIANPLDDHSAMLDRRIIDPESAQKYFNNLPIIHGHFPTPINEINEAIASRSRVIPLDNGCVYNKPHSTLDYTQLGSLCCFNPDSWQLVVQPNVE